jgi:peptide/nickel transport system substrate-binding protein
LVEGVMGAPRFVNPLLAVSDADRDLSALVYSGLLKALPEGGFVPDLAQSYSISPDALSYTFAIRPDATFHDGTSVTADDVVFTIGKAQDAALKSPRRASWDGVTVEKLGERQVRFTLKQPYAPFLSSLTLGILPARLWKDVAPEAFAFSDLNVKPVGSGPYTLSAMNTSGGSASEAVLDANPNYTLGRPYIDTIDLKFFPSEDALVDALKSGDVKSASNLSPHAAQELSNDGRRIETAPLSRVFGVFFNQNQNELLARKEVRQALDTAIDRPELIDDVLSGYGVVADGPLPPRTGAAAVGAPSSATSSSAAARTILAKAGWKLNGNDVFELKPKTKGAASTTLALSLSTANVPELVLAAKSIEDAWTDAGVRVDVRVFEPGDLNQGVIRPRQYDALLFGIVTGRNADLYPFWHSSQRTDPGLNIASYTNAKADKYLEAMRRATSTDESAALYAKFKAEVTADIPAAFLWSPQFAYAVPKNLQGMKLGEIAVPSDRFLSVQDWYLEADHVWKIFTKNYQN